MENKLRYYVYYNYGSCNYGDHSAGIDTYDTLEEVKKRVDELKAHSYYDDSADIFVIYGIPAIGVD